MMSSTSSIACFCCWFLVLRSETGASTILCACSVTELHSQNMHHFVMNGYFVYRPVLMMTLTRLTWSMTWATVENVKTLFITDIFCKEAQKQIRHCPALPLL